MAKAWNLQLQLSGASWNVPASLITAFGALVNAADTALTKVQNTASRTHLDSVACHDAFEALTDAMRSMKRRYFFMPPLTREDWAALLLPFPDEHPTLVPVPEAQATADTLAVGHHQVQLKFRIDLGALTDDQRAEYGYGLWYGTLNTDAATSEVDRLRAGYLTRIPLGPDELHIHRFTRRKEIVIDFPYGDSGRTVYFCIQFENAKGDRGDWGTIFSAVIP
jgi:hypothetical protein